MGTLKDIYEVVKDSLKNLKDLAKKMKNQEMLELAMDIQDKIFEIKDQMQELKETNLTLSNDLRVANNEIQTLSGQLVDYKALKSKLDELERGDGELAFYNEEVVLNFTEICYVISSSTIIKRKTLKFTLDNVFKAVSLKMMTPINKNEFVDAFTSLCEGYYVDENQALQIKAQFLALGLIEISINKKDDEVIKLTNKGLKEMQKLNTIKQGEN